MTPKIYDKHTKLFGLALFFKTNITHQPPYQLLDALTTQIPRIGTNP